MRALVAIVLCSCVADHPRPRPAPIARGANPPAVAAADEAAPRTADAGAALPLAGRADPPAVAAADAAAPRTAGAGAASPSPGTITDDECLRRGGHIETEQTWAHLRRDRPDDQPPMPYRICRIPSPRNGEECSGDGDCAGGRCFCTGELAGPDVARRRPGLMRLDGTAAVGRCSDQPVPSGSWWCLVEDAKVMIHGIIID